MSINIDKKLFRSAVGWVELAQALPLDLNVPNLTYDGEFIKFSQGAGAGWPAILVMGRRDGGVELNACAKGYFKTTDAYVFVLCFEPYKGNFDNYQGIDTRGSTVHRARSRLAGVETATTLSGQDWTVERTFKLTHQTDQTDMYFYVDGTEVAHHTTNISAQPFSLAFGEPDNAAKEIYLRWPRGVWAW